VLIEVLFNDGLTIVAVTGPPVCDHEPEPVTGIFPARFVNSTPHFDWSGPASAIVGAAATVTVTVMQLLGVHPGLAHLTY